jgi:glucose/arabinose dehydrogenase
MNKKTIFILLTSLVILVALGVVFVNSNGMARLPLSSGFGPNPELPPPDRPILPVLNVVDAKGWANGEKPVAAEGMEVAVFARDLDHPRWVYVLPNGDVLVAETNAPERPDDAPGFKGWFFNYFKQKAGAGTPSADRITLLRDADGDGVVDTRSVFLTDLHSPFGMALVGDTLYVANTDGIVQFPYEEGQTEITAEPTIVTDLPAGSINHHWTKNIIASPDGSKLYASVGSNSDVAENGMDKEEGRAAIWEVDLENGTKRLFATGLRNPVGMAWEPESGMLWTSVNERDELGSDLVPDYMTSVRDGGFYGWPYVYYGKHLEPRVTPNPEMAAKAIVPDYALGPHTASLGLSNSVGNKLPERFANGMFVGQHGSWNRKPFSGYKVLFVPFTGGMPSGEPLDVLTGFIKENGEAMGRPVGVAVDKYGALLVVDDVGNIVWRVTATTATSQ